VDAVVVTDHPRSGSELVSTHETPPDRGDMQVDLPATSTHGEPLFDVLGHIARLEASNGAALALLRRCIVERQAPTREALAAEAEFAFGMPSDAALAEMDQIAEMVGVSSLR
jgi:hypothetical protein